MINKSIPLILGLVLIHFLGLAQELKITGALSHAPATANLQLYRSSESGWTVLDTIALDQGKASCILDRNLPRGWYKIGTDLRNSFDVILGKEALKFTGDYNQLSISVTIIDSPENELLQSYLAFYSQHQADRQKIAGMSNQPRGTLSREEWLALLQQKLDSMEIIKNRYHLQLAQQSPDLFIGKLADFYSYDSTTSSKNYFTEDNFQDPELLMASFYQNKVLTYFQRFVPRDLISWGPSGNYLIALSEPQSEGREFIFLSLVYLFKSVSPDLAREVAVQYHQEYPQSLSSKRLLASLPKSGPSVGETAPDIILKDSTGTEKALSSLRGKYVLLDFWASWCGPCRRENPNVVRVYEEYKSKGFTVFSVSLDHSREKWLGAIEKDQLNWHHVSDLKGWRSDGAAIYNVRSIPATFLIDPNGKIIAKNLRGAQLEKTLGKSIDPID